MRASDGLGPPDRIGKFSIIRSLGAGGIGEVFLATRDGGGPPVALKRLRAEAAASARPRFMREAHLVSMIDHPNVTRLLHAEWAGDDFLIATEFVPGKDLEALLRRSIAAQDPIPPMVAVPVVLSVLEALIAIHELTDPEGKPVLLVHRDLAPKNLMLAFSGITKVIDFGIARSDVDQFRTSTGHLVGTPAYFSPEQAQGEEIDARSDLYTVGVVLHELLTARRLVPTNIALGAIVKVVSAPAVPPSQLEPRAPAELDPIVMKGLEKDRKLRWQSAREFRDALLEAARKIELWDPPRIGAYLRDAFPEDAASQAQVEWEAPLAEPTRLEQPRPRSRALGWMGAALAVAAVASLFAVLQRRPPVDPIAPASAPPAVEIVQRPEARPVATDLPPPPSPPPPIAVRPRKPKPAASIDPPAPDPLRLSLAEVSRGGFDLARAEAFLEALEKRAKSASAKNAVARARRCLTVCDSSKEKMDQLTRALKESED